MNNNSNPTNQMNIPLETGMNRYQDWQIEEDLANQELTRSYLESLLNIKVEPQPELSIWDWEFRINDRLLGIGEYRRRFNKFGFYPDFRFSKKKFDAMKKKAKDENIIALMFVQFNDQFLYFKIEGKPLTEILRRNHEVRTEECVCIPNNWFKPLNDLEVELLF
jgi:hypothetical protein